MRSPLANPWFQLAGLVAVVSGGISAYNEAATGAYSGTPRLPDTTSVQSPASAPAGAGDPSAVAYAPQLGVDLAAMTNTASGLLYRDLTLGTGAMADSTSWVKVNWTGWLPDGSKFGANAGGGPDPFQLGVGSIITGWEEGLRGMKAGGKRLVVIPSNLGYGTTGGAGIPPNSVLVLELQLVSVEPGAPQAAAPAPAATSPRTSAKVTPVRSGTQADLHSVSFWSATQGVAVGKTGSILRTGDGGTTWARGTALTGRDIYGVTALPSGESFAVGDSGTILFQDIGSGSWRPTRNAVSVPLSEVRFGGASATGIIAGGLGTILRTVNGGGTWATVPSQVNTHLSTPAFADASLGIVVGAEGTILRTTDGGATWTVRPLPAGVPKVSLNGVAWVHGEVWVIVGEEGRVLWSVDGGRSWSARPSPTTNTLISVTFASPATLGNAGIPTAMPLGVAVGHSGTILVSKDEGATWSVVPSGTTQHLFSVALPTPTEAVVVGYGGTILKLRL